MKNIFEPYADTKKALENSRCMAQFIGLPNTKDFANWILTKSMYVVVEFWLVKRAYFQKHFKKPTGNFSDAPLCPQQDHEDHL